jgi:hypothetical protein
MYKQTYDDRASSMIQRREEVFHVGGADVVDSGGHSVVWVKVLLTRWSTGGMLVVGGRDGVEDGE